MKTVFCEPTISWIVTATGLSKPVPAGLRQSSAESLIHWLVMQIVLPTLMVGEVLAMAKFEPKMETDAPLEVGAFGRTTYVTDGASNVKMLRDVPSAFETATKS